MEKQHNLKDPDVNQSYQKLRCDFFSCFYFTHLFASATPWLTLCTICVIFPG